mgnify:CR=1 FL=1
MFVPVSSSYGRITFLQWHPFAQDLTVKGKSNGYHGRNCNWC